MKPIEEVYMENIEALLKEILQEQKEQTLILAHIAYLIYDNDGHKPEYRHRGNNASLSYAGKLRDFISDRLH